MFKGAPNLFFAFIGFTFLPFLSAAQDSSSVIKSIADSFVIRKVLIIPFDPKMYISDSDRDIQEKSGIGFREMLTRFRSGLSVEVKSGVPGWWEAFLLEDSPDSLSDIKRVYHSLSYKYELLDEKTMGAKPQGLRKKPETQENKIEKGQIKIEEDNRLKFMNVHFKNDTILDYLADKYGVQYFLFLNQFDLIYDMQGYVSTGNKTLKRLVRVHYSILHKNGDPHFAGLAVSEIPAEMKEVQAIITTHFPAAAKIIDSHLPPPIPVKKRKGK